MGEGAWFTLAQGEADMRRLVWEHDTAALPGMRLLCVLTLTMAGRIAIPRKPGRPRASATHVLVWDRVTPEGLAVLDPNGRMTFSLAEVGMWDAWKDPIGRGIGYRVPRVYERWATLVPGASAASVVDLLSASGRPVLNLHKVLPVADAAVARVPSSLAHMADSGHVVLWATEPGTPPTITGHIDGGTRLSWGWSDGR